MLKVDRNRLPYLEGLALVLENEGDFYKDYGSRSTPLQARDLIHNWDVKTANQRGLGKGSVSTIADEREFIRRYLNKRWNVSQDVGLQRSRERDADPDFSIGDSELAPDTPIDYSKLPDGTRLFTKGGGEYIKGKPPEDLEGLSEDMRVPGWFANRLESGRPVYGYKTCDGKLTGWQDWRADGTLGSVSTNVSYLELTGYDATPSGGLVPVTNLNARDDQIDASLYTQPQPAKEITMNNIIEITTKTLINGQDIANYSNAQLYEIIAQQEKKLAELDAIKNKPNALKKELADRQAGIDALVAHLDSREETK